MGLVTEAKTISLDPKALAAEAQQAEREEREQKYRVGVYEQQIQVIRMMLSRWRPAVPAKAPADDMITPLMLLIARGGAEMNVPLGELQTALTHVYTQHEEMLKKGREIKAQQEADAAAKEASAPAVA